MVTRHLCLATLAALALACATPTPTSAPSSTAAGAPSVEMRGLDGSAQALKDGLQNAERTLVVFATVWCEACKTEWPQVAAWAVAEPGRQVLYVISGSAPDRVAAFATERSLAQPRVRVVVDSDGAFARAYDVRATPTLVPHDSNGPTGPAVHEMAALSP